MLPKQIEDNGVGDVPCDEDDPLETYLKLLSNKKLKEGSAKYNPETKRFDQKESS